MTAQTPALPSLDHRNSERRHTGRGRWFGGVLGLLAFGFAANALLSTPRAAVELSPTAYVVATPVAASDTGSLSGESDEVRSAVRAWVWETAETGRAPSRQHDVEELWLPR